MAQERVFALATADELTAELARAQEEIAGGQRAFADTHADLDAERVRSAELGRAREHAEAELARDRALSQASDRDVTVALARVREALAEMQRVLASTQAQLDAECSATMTLRQELDRAREDGETITQERVFAQATADELTAELARAHEITAARERAIADTQSQLDAEHLCSAELNQELERIESELAATRERGVEQESNRGLAEELADVREALAGSQRALAEAQAALDFERAQHAEPRGPMERLELAAAPAGRRSPRGRDKERSPVEPDAETEKPVYPVNRHAFPSRSTSWSTARAGCCSICRSPDASCSQLRC